MKSRRRRYSRPKPSAAGPEPIDRLEAWKLILGASVAILVVLIPLVWKEVKDEAPAFAISNPILRSDADIVIVAQNRRAEVDKNLNVEFDGILLPGVGVPDPDSRPQTWRVSLRNLTTTPAMVAEAEHTLRVGFAGGPLSEPLKIVFSDSVPEISFRVMDAEGTENQKIIEGYAATKSQDPEEMIRLDVAFNVKGASRRVPIPVERIVDETSGRVFFRFSTTVQGFSLFSPSEPEFSEAFFAIRLADQAGNEYFHQMTYAQFVAPGRMDFGVRNVAAIEVLSRYDDEIGGMQVDFKLTPTQDADAEPDDTTHDFDLHVTTIEEDIQFLEWTSLPEHLRAGPPITTILRNEKHLGVSLGGSFIDDGSDGAGSPVYRVEQLGADEVVYSSGSAVSQSRVGAFRVSFQSVMVGPGTSFDAFSAPDLRIRVYVDGRTECSVEGVPDSYSPTWEPSCSVLSRTNETIRIEMWDLDLFTDDLVGHWTGTVSDLLGGSHVRAGQVAIRYEIAPGDNPDG